MRAIAAMLIAAMLAARPVAAAAPPPFGHACVAQNGVRFCPTTSLADRVPTWDGLPLDIDVTLPPTGDGPFPTIFMLHGLGGSKVDFEATTPAGTSNATFHYNNVFYAQRGYLVVNYSARGWGNSCGAPTSRTTDCATGWIRLADQRWEIRDTQHLMGVLVDAGLADPEALGATGVSYGGGQSLELAAQRYKLRNTSGKLQLWRSPARGRDGCGRISTPRCCRTVASATIACARSGPPSIRSASRRSSTPRPCCCWRRCSTASWPCPTRTRAPT